MEEKDIFKAVGYDQNKTEVFIFSTKHLTASLQRSNKELRNKTKANLKKVFEFNSSRMRNWTIIVFIDFETDTRKIDNNGFRVLDKIFWSTIK